MNTLITILVFAFILLVAVVIAFLAGLHAAKLGVQEIIRDTLIKNKKEEGYYAYGYTDDSDSEYEEDEDEEDSQHMQQCHQRHIVEEHYSLGSHDGPTYPYYQHPHSGNCSRKPDRHYHYNVGDDMYLARLKTHHAD